MKYLIKLILIPFVLSGCSATHDGYFLSPTTLSSNNFTYVKKGLKGSAKATYFLGMGGLHKQTLVYAAKRNLMSDTLLDGQAMANITVNWKTTYGILIITKQCTITADLVQFK